MQQRRRHPGTAHTKQERPSTLGAVRADCSGKAMSMATLKNSLLGVALGTALLLLVPAVAMQISSEVSWGPGDFLAAAVLLFASGSIAVLGLRQVSGEGRRLALVLALAFGLAVVWAELAVGLFS